jgi:hypothetical protein
MLNSKFWQAFFALAPIIIGLIAIFGYFFFIFSMISTIQEIEANGEPPTAIFAGMGIFFIAILFVILVSLSSLIFYIVHAVQNPNLKENNLLIVWILLFVFVSGIGQLIYWIVEIISKRKNLPA